MSTLPAGAAPAPRPGSRRSDGAARAGGIPLGLGASRWGWGRAGAAQARQGGRGRARGSGSRHCLSAGSWKGTGSGRCTGLSSRSATTSRCCEYLGGPDMVPACWGRPCPFVGVWRGERRHSAGRPVCPCSGLDEGLLCRLQWFQPMFVHSISCSVTFRNSGGARSGAPEPFPGAVCWRMANPGLGSWWAHASALSPAHGGCPNPVGTFFRWEIVAGYGMEKASYGVQIPELAASPDPSAGI